MGGGKKYKSYLSPLIILLSLSFSNLSADCISHYNDISGEVRPVPGDIVLREVAHGWKNYLGGGLGHVGIITPDSNILGYMLPDLYTTRVMEVMDN